MNFIEIDGLVDLKATPEKTAVQGDSVFLEGAFTQSLLPKPAAILPPFFLLFFFLPS